MSEGDCNQVLGLSFEEPEEIGALDKGSQLRIEVAGLLGRSEKKISVAQKFSSEIRRFTGAHEIAHYLIHPDMSNFRESPITEGSIRYQQKFLREKEADLFAAELLRDCYGS
jgi:Zn-dependent peptidase ImmA (M78 family)